MTPNEQHYRRTINNIAFTMLLFLACFQIVSLLLSLLASVVDDAFGPVWSDVVYEISYGLMYAITFIVPALFFLLLSKKTGHEPIRAEFKLPKQTPLFIFSGIAAILGAAYINAMIVQAMPFFSIFDVFYTSQEADSNHQLVLMFFTVAVVPAFVEELLFRGVVLSNLLPYNRTTAVLVSALLFGLMHQNVKQFFYATVGGVVLGLLYIYTNSIWPCILLHFCNNFFSVFETAISQRLDESIVGTVIATAELVIFVLGALSVVILILSQSDRLARIRQSGCFGQSHAFSPDRAEVKIPFTRRVRLFFSAPMIVFIALAVMQTISTIVLLAVIYFLYGGILV